MDDLKKVIKTKKILEDTPYKNLGEKLSELGVPEVFDKGAKKEELIQLALQKLEEIGKFEKSDFINEVLEGEILKGDKSDEDEDEVLAEVSEEGEVQSYVYTKKDIEEAILINESNLKQCTTYLRAILLRKQKELSDLLEAFN